MEKILVLVDQDETRRAGLDKAATLARCQGATLELFTCCFSASLVASYPFDPDAREHAKHGYLHGQEKHLEELAEPLRASGLEVTTDVSWDASRERAVLLKVARYRPDLVVKNCSLHRRLGIQLFGQLDWQLIRDCPVPLLLTREAPWAAHPLLVACVDPMHAHDKPASLDRKILQVAANIAGLLDGALKLLHSFQPLPMSVIFDDTLVVDYDRFRTQLRERHRGALEALAEQGPLAGTELCLREGEPGDVLPQFADEVAADMVLMGAVSRTILDRVFIGSTAERVLDHIHCDLLVIKGDDFPWPASDP